MSISNYLAKLVELKNQLVANLRSMGVAADESEKLNTLVPKVLECKTEQKFELMENISNFSLIKNNIQQLFKYIELPQGVVSIGDQAFYGCTGLESIKIPEGVTTIGYNAFNGTSLKSITIPDSVTSIGGSAFFADCLRLSEIVVGQNNSNYCTVNGALMNINKTKLMKFPTAKTIDEYVIVDGTETIEQYCFQKISNMRIIIPTSLTRIKTSAFVSCKYIDIFYKGTKSEWDSITKDSYWDNNNSFVTYNYNYVPE